MEPVSEMKPVPGMEMDMKRKTIQRDLTQKAVQKLQDHPTADEVYAEVSREHPNISRGTIYRNLNQLSDDGEIRTLEVPGGADRYDHCTGKHYHIRCIRCGHVFDVDMDYMPDMENAIKDAHGFQILGHDLMFRGICPDCAAGQEEQAKIEKEEKIDQEDKKDKIDKEDAESDADCSGET